MSQLGPPAARDFRPNSPTHRPRANGGHSTRSASGGAMRSFIQRVPGGYVAATIAITIAIGLILSLTRSAPEIQPAVADEGVEERAATSPRANAALPERVDPVRAPPAKASPSEVFAQGSWG